MEMAPPPRVCQTRGVDRTELRHVKEGYQKPERCEQWVLPEAFRVEVAGLAGALTPGLTASGVKAALVMAQPMLEAEVTQVAGAKGKYRAARPAQRHGPPGGDVAWAGRTVKIPRPRVRTVDGPEVLLQHYRGWQQQDLLDEAAFERMLYAWPAAITRR